MQPQFVQSRPSAQAVADEQSAFMRKVYLFMSGGLTATAVAAYAVAGSETLSGMIYKNPMVFWGLIIVELLMVWRLASAVRSMSAVGAGLLFVAYSIVNGLTLSFIFRLYTQSSIGSTFLVTAGTFGAMSVYGSITKRDLSGVGSFMTMGLFGLILASIVNIFLHSTMIYWLTTFMGVFIFTGLAAYDTQKIRALNVIGNAGTDEDHKEAIHGALILYLDFLNLFLYLLRLLGRRR